jgi:hypothetical protein
METRSIDEACVIEAVHDVPFSQLHDELLGISQQRGYCYALNPSAARIWELIQAPVQVGSVCAALCSEFAIEPDLCYRDVVDFLANMKTAGLIEVRNGGI